MNDILILQRAAKLALMADSRVADNPSVGAVLVHAGRIIGEGYHRQAGKAHAEVSCLASVRSIDRHLIASSTLYVTLEPCCIRGRTPACTSLILKEKIPTVVFAQRDTTPEVSGRGAAILRQAGVEVREYPDFEPGRQVNAKRKIFTTQQRPYVILKYARSTDGWLRPRDRKAEYWITNPISRRLVHRWRSRTNAILIGARTVLEDEPSLTTRLFPGPNPRPVIVDLRDRLTGHERLFNEGVVRPLVFCGTQPTELRADLIELKKKELGKKAIGEILTHLHRLRIGQVTVEGGSTILSAFLEAGYWDEARLFTGAKRFGQGVIAPPLPESAQLASTTSIGTDRLEIYHSGGN